MAIARLEFDLNDNDDRLSHARSIKSTEMACVLFEIERNLRSKCEHLLENKVDVDNFAAIEIVFNEISYLMEQNNIDLEHLLD